MVVPLYGKNGPDVRIRRVRVLQGRLRELADDKGINPEDLVLVTTTIEKGKHPPVQYKLEKVEGDPVSFMLKRAGRGG
ncbi:MAG: hypothetical protein GH150_04670 [Hadesarchaea archaeon]|nr:hypothetical protein [Hadesarchaea archaeon]